ncbi:MAG: hypothetical protein GY749_45800, partial [Desulfobacteraceae bacterium]|nr:hypothetical protein [Desulfobacteraceae bacterium]
LKELCGNLRHNTDSVLANVRIRNEMLSDELKQKILFLKNEKIWMDFVSNASREGRKVRNSVLSASNGAGKDLMLCLMGMFSRFSESEDGTVFNPDMLKQIEHKTPKARKPGKY